MSSRAVTTDYKQLIRDSILNHEDFIKATFSGQHRDRAIAWMKVIVRPVLVRGQKHVQTAHNTIDITITNKGKALIHSTTSSVQPKEANLAHDRQKKVLLTADDAAPFLKAVGIMTQDGKIRAVMQSKFRQINEFLKLVQQTGELEKFNASPLYV